MTGMFESTPAFLQDLQPWSRSNSLGGLGAELDASLINCLALPQKAHQTLALDSGTSQLHPFANETDAATTCGTRPGDDIQGTKAPQCEHAAHAGFQSQTKEALSCPQVRQRCSHATHAAAIQQACLITCAVCAGWKFANRMRRAAAAAAQSCHTVYASRQCTVLGPVGRASAFADNGLNLTTLLADLRGTERHLADSFRVDVVPRPTETLGCMDKVTGACSLNPTVAHVNATFTATVRASSSQTACPGNGAVLKSWAFAVQAPPAFRTTSAWQDTVRANNVTAANNCRAEHAAGETHKLAAPSLQRHKLFEHYTRGERQPLRRRRLHHVHHAVP